ncbi:MAG: diadenylate cyclase CdaA [Oscillospiraceae bacterium]|nr:diadenylate cyclase CdaA [Oscillospiraceae bacterium]
MDWFSSAWQVIRSYIDLIRITDILDMAIIAYVIYRLLLVLRRSRSGQVLRAIIIIIVALAVSSFLNLHVITFVLSRAVEIGLLALVIIFQPELRRFLEGIGSGGIRRLFSREHSPEVLENAISQTVEAYTNFSKEKVGALMVFERKVLLDDIIKTGSPLDAAVSADLLSNLFWNKAPLHDGAVIVRKGRIVAAGCVLPLSSNMNLSKELGTRHRAGVGVSENSDAVVAIVSEETGSISVAINGSLQRHLTPETLEQILRRELLTDEEETSKGRTYWERFRDFVTGRTKKLKKGESDDGKTDS